MGRVKDLWMEMENHEWEEIDALFKCPHCTEGDSGHVEVPVIYEGMGEVERPVTLRCHFCDTEFEGWITVDWDESKIALDDYRNLTVHSEPVRGFQNPPEIDWDDFYRPDHVQTDDGPYTLLVSNLNGINRLLTQSATLLDQELMLRMLLVQAVTALETFLGDTLLLEVNNREDAQKRLLMNNKLEIGTIKVLLKETFGIENFAHQKLMGSLRTVSYHNINKVQKLYQ